MSARPSGGDKPAVFLTGHEAGIANAVCLPIMCASAFLFWRRRHIHPIQERYPQLVTLFNVTCIFLVLVNCWSDFLGTLVPCWAYNQLINTILAPTLGLCLWLRAWLLLFNFEITRDMLNMEQRIRHYGVALNNNGGLAARLAKDFKHSPGHRASLPSPGSPHHNGSPRNGNGGAATGSSTTAPVGFVGLPPPMLTHQPSMAAMRISMQSWYTRHHRLIKPSFLKRMIITLEVIWIALYIGVSIYDPSACAHISETAYALGNYNLFGWCGLEVISIAVMAVKLARHGGDGFGIKSEFKAQALLGAVLLVILVSVMDHSDDPLNDFLTLCIFFGVNVLSVMWPIARSYQFERRQRALAAQVQRIVKLDDLLAIPEGAQAFWSFLASEFSSELLGFHQHVVAFRAMGTGSQQQPPQPPSSLQVTTSTGTGTGTAAGSTTPNGGTAPPASPQPFVLDDHVNSHRRASIRIHGHTNTNNTNATMVIKTEGDSPRTPNTPNGGHGSTVSPNNGGHAHSRLFASAVIASNNSNTVTTTDSVISPTAAAATGTGATITPMASSSSIPISGSPPPVAVTRLSSSSPVYNIRPHRASLVTNGTGTGANAVVLGASPGFGPLHAPEDRSQQVDPHGDQRIRAVLSEADDIFSLFVVDGAPFQINISAATRSGVYNSMERYRAMISVHVHETPIRAPLTIQQVDDTVIAIRHIFDEADEAVMQLMSTGSFARFRAGAFYQRLIDSLQVNGSPSSGPKSAVGGGKAGAPSRPQVGSDLHVSSMVGREGSHHSPKTGGAAAAPASPPPISSPKVGQVSQQSPYGANGGPRFYSRSDPSAFAPGQYTTGPLAGHRSNPSTGSNLPIGAAVTAITAAATGASASPVNGAPVTATTTDVVNVWIDPALPATQSHTSLSPFSRSPQLPHGGHQSHGSNGGLLTTVNNTHATVTPVTSKLVNTTPVTATTTTTTMNGTGSVRSLVLTNHTILATIQNSNNRSSPLVYHD